MPMKRWLWLAALPWTIAFSTCTFHGNPGDDLWLNGYDRQVITCNYSEKGKESAEDLAAALNEAHERRAQKPKTQLRTYYDDRIQACPQTDGSIGPCE